MAVRRVCLECCQTYEVTKGWQRFCSRSCRGTFHRRREKRGAEMYDLVMAWSFDRKDTGPKALKILCEMAATFRAEDTTAGRPRGSLTLRVNSAERRYGEEGASQWRTRWTAGKY